MAESARAAHLLGLGRHAEAASLLAPLLATDPDSADLHGLMAQALLGLEDPAGALAEGNRMVALDPSGEWGHRICSIALSRLGQHHEAARAAHETVRLAPHDWRGHVQLASATSATWHRLPEAQRAARRAVELAPDEADAHFAVGIVEQRASNKELARTAYQHTLRLEPQHAMARNNLTVLDRHRSIRRAVAGYTAALSADPDSATARANLDIQVRRFARRLYLGAVASYLVALPVTVPDAQVAPSPASIGLAVVVLAAFGWSGRRLAVSVPTGTRRYAVGRLRSDLEVTGRTALAALALACTLAMCLVPGFAPIGAGLFGPLVLANIALVVISLAARRR